MEIIASLWHGPPGHFTSTAQMIVVLVLPGPFGVDACARLAG